MNVIAKIFKKKKDKDAQETTKTIQELRDHEEVLVKKQNFLETKIEKELQTARQHGTTNKRVAKQALRRKKRYEKELQHIDGTLSTLEMQRETLQSANMNTAVLTTMKIAADAIKAAHQFKDIDEIHDMMEDIGEQWTVSKEVSDAISKSFGYNVDEEELEKELEELEKENKDNLSVKLPSAPCAKPDRSAKKTGIKVDDKNKQPGIMTAAC